MIPWFIILFVPALVMGYNRTELVISKKGEKKINLGLAVCFMILFVFRGFRSISVGGDVIRYEVLFNELGRMDWTMGLTRSGYEVGYLAYCKLLYMIHPDYRTVLIVTSAINTYSILRFVSKNSENPGLSLYCYIGLFFYAQSFNNERQAVAISLLMIAYEYVKSKQLFKFYLLVILASTFHISSVLFIAIYYLADLRFERGYWVAFVLSIGVAILGGAGILGYVINRISFLNAKYSSYELDSGAGYRLFALIIVTILSQLFFFPREEREEDDLRIILHMLNFSAILQCFSFRIGFFSRAVQIYYVSEILYFAKVITKLSTNEKNNILARSMICLIILAYFVFMLNTNGIAVVPYSMASLQ